MRRAYRKRRLATLTQRLRRFETIDAGTGATACAEGRLNSRFGMSTGAVNWSSYISHGSRCRPPAIARSGLELVQALGVASLLRQLRGTRSALIEIRKIRPHIGRRKRIGRRIPIGAWFPLVGSGRK